MPASLIGPIGDALRGRTAVFAAWLASADPVVAETLLREDFGGAVLDMQHGGFDVASAERVIGACALVGKPAIVRVPLGDFATAARMLDCGAAGIIAPMIDSADEARRLVEFTKYLPLGRRSWGPGRATSLGNAQGNDYLREGNRLHLTIAMIETREGLEALDAILAVPGIDGVYVGPSDLSIGLSQGGLVDPASAAVDAALTHIEARAKAAGKFSGLFCFTGREAAAMAARGFSLLTIATDLMFMRQAARAELAAANT